MTTFRIEETSDGKHVGDIITTDLKLITTSDGTEFAIAGTVQLGEGRVRAFNSNYVFELNPSL